MVNSVWQCDCCSYTYDEAVGHSPSGILPGTAWQALPARWMCPSCGASKSAFAPLSLEQFLQQLGLVTP